MVYCEPADVKRHIETAMGDPDIVLLIVEADAELDELLGSYSMDTDLKKRCSSLLTAIAIAEKQPESYTVGSLRISHGNRIERWRARVEELVARAQSARVSVRVSSYQVIDEDVRYPE